MVRVAVHYENRLGRNDGNPLYVLGALKRMAEQERLEVDHLIPFPGEVERFGKYDLHVWVDWGEDALTGLLPYVPVYPPGHPLIYWASDTHLGYAFRLERARRADLVFCAQKRAVEEFKRDGVEAHWLPHAVEPLAYTYSEDSVVIPMGKSIPIGTPRKFNYVSKKYDVCFVGHINADNRIDALDRLFKEFPNFFYGQRLFNDAADKFAQSKIVFNVSHKDDLNMRVFEALGSGAFLLTNDIPTIHDLFEDGKHLVTYKDLDDMVAKAHHYLSHDEERERIALAGQEEVLAHHTIDHRVQRMLELSKPLLTEEVHA